mmetsp:Transcript_18925/g.24712  ORF Transcript_18925/g.24712 Transcript_18925/m.24712 type:complete len:80 (+) Transcript_18925:3-242(+)
MLSTIENVFNTGNRSMEEFAVAGLENDARKMREEGLLSRDLIEYLLDCDCPHYFLELMTETLLLSKLKALLIVFSPLTC